MTLCRIPEFYERYKINIGIFDLKSRRILPKTVELGHICVHTLKNYYCVFWKKNRIDSLLNGVEETSKSFKYVKNKISESSLKH